VRRSLSPLDDADGRFLDDTLRAQSDDGRVYRLTEDDARKLATLTVTRPNKAIAVSVPDDSAIAEDIEAAPAGDVRESIRIQALIADIGTLMGLSIWLPRADRVAVLKEMKSDSPTVLDTLPLSYDDAALRTIEQIDVLCFEGDQS
jgi:hypothetical protein